MIRTALIVGAIAICLAAWFGLSRIPWLQERHILLLTLRIGFSMLIVYVAVAMFALISISQHRIPPLSYPETTYGEFSFRFEYEIDGEYFLIEDTLISVFEESRPGTAFSEPVRVWRTTLQSAGEELRFLLMDKEDVAIYFTTGLSSYFMGDRNAHEATIIPNPMISSQPRIVITGSDGLFEVIYKDSEDRDKLLAEHGITLISWEYASPIINKFSN